MISTRSNLNLISIVKDKKPGLNTTFMYCTVTRVLCNFSCWKRVWNIRKWCKFSYFWTIWKTHTAKTQYRRFETNIPRKGIAWPQSQFPHSCVSERFIFSHKRSFLLQENMWCCYITVDSATTALQNCARTYWCISKQMHYKTPFSHNCYTKSLEFYDNYIPLFWLEKKKFFYSIILTQNHPWHIT